MGKLLMLIGQRLMISDKHRTVRQSFIFVLVNMLLFGGIVFILEVILIVLGVGGVFIPWSHTAISYLRAIF
jgi:hypothetical protein